MKKQKLLLVNDDGIHSPELHALDGTPADCTNAGIYHLCPEKPDLVISGINVGVNIGDAYILSSGTVGSAAEGVIAGIPSIALSVEFDHDTTRKIEFHPAREDIRFFSFAAGLCVRLAKAVLALDDPPEGVLFNLNMGEHAGPDTEIVLTSPARYSYGPFLAEKESIFVHRGMAKDLSSAPPGMDMYAPKHRRISLSPLRLLSRADTAGDIEIDLVKYLNDN